MKLSRCMALLCPYQEYQGRTVSPAIWLALCFLLPLQVRGQLVVKLAPQTLSEFERYAQQVQQELNERWKGSKKFLSIEEQPQELAKVHDGELFIEQRNGGKPVAVTDGLIHDWVGAIYIPHTTVENVVSLLEDFDRHHAVYPAVAKSHTVKRDGNEVVGSWRLEQKGLVPVILNVDEEARYAPLAAGRWKGEAYARHITEVDTSLFSRGRVFPADEGHGYLWRLYSYWSLERSGDGVLAECRTLSLSRDIPAGLAWAVEPYVQKMPHDSLASLLKNTRKALSR